MSAKCFGILAPGCTQQRTSVPHCQLTAFLCCHNNDPDETPGGKSDLAEKCDCACFKHCNDFLYCILTSNSFSAFSPCLKMLLFCTGLTWMMSVKDENPNSPCCSSSNSAAIAFPAGCSTYLFFKNPSHCASVVLLNTCKKPQIKAMESSLSSGTC